MDLELACVDQHCLGACLSSLVLNSLVVSFEVCLVEVELAVIIYVLESDVLESALGLV